MNLTESYLIFFNVLKNIESTHDIKFIDEGYPLSTNLHEIDCWQSLPGERKPIGKNLTAV